VESWPLVEQRLRREPQRNLDAPRTSMLAVGQQPLPAELIAHVPVRDAKALLLACALQRRIVIGFHSLAPTFRATAPR